MNDPITLIQGNLPLLTGALVDGMGAAVDLTGCTVQFVLQQLSQPLGTGSFSPYGFTAAANVVGTATQGNVAYQLSSGQTATLGDYQAQWIVTNGTTGLATIYPLSWPICLRIVPPASTPSPTNIVLIAQMFEPTRAALGDLGKKKRYEDDALAATLRTCLAIGRVPGQTVTADRRGIAPGIVVASDMALLMYHAAKMILQPASGQYRYRLRPLEESFGRQDYFVRELDNAIYELENGDMLDSFQSFYAWVNALTGLDIWSVLTDMNTSAPVATVSIGRAGVTVATT